MTRARVRFRLSVAVVAATLSPVANLAAQRTPADWSPLERVVAEQLRAKGIPGVVVMVANARRVIYSGAFGLANADTKEVLTTNHLMQVGSITKTFTALMALQLKTRGTVDFDIPVGGAIAGLPKTIASLTMRDLLHQRAGLRDVAGDDGPDAEDQLIAYVRSLGDTMQVLPPGAAFSYSNVGFALAGAAAQEWARQPFADLLRVNVLTPLGMTRSTMRPEEAIRSAHAAGHVGTPGGAGEVADGIINDTRLWPAGYLWSSGDDMGRFLQALVSEGRARTGGGLFRGVVDSAFAPAVSVPGLPNETRYGFGVFVDRSPWGERVWHPGSVTGFSAYWAAVPASRLAVAVLTNRDGVRLEPIADAAFLVAMGARPSAARSGGKSARAPRAGGSQARRRDGASMASAAADNSSDESPVPRAQALSLEGVYEGRFPVELRWRDNSLQLLRFGTALTVRSIGGDRYRARAPGASTADDIIITPPMRGGREPYIQMYLWAFVRTRP